MTSDSTEQSQQLSKSLFAPGVWLFPVLGIVGAAILRAIVAPSRGIPADFQQQTEVSVLIFLPLVVFCVGLAAGIIQAGRLFKSGQSSSWHVRIGALVLLLSCAVMVSSIFAVKRMADYAELRRVEDLRKAGLPELQLGPELDQRILDFDPAVAPILDRKDLIEIRGVGFLDMAGKPVNGVLEDEVYYKKSYGWTRVEGAKEKVSGDAQRRLKREFLIEGREFGSETRNDGGLLESRRYTFYFDEKRQRVSRHEHGVIEKYTDDHVLLSYYTYRNGKTHGLCKSAAEGDDGVYRITSEGKAEGGKSVGTWLFYDHNTGLKKSEKIYHDNGHTELIAYYPESGVVKSRLHYKGKIQVGTWEYFFEDATNKETKNYNDEGNLEGKQQRWSKPGVLSDEKIYQDQKLREHMYYTDGVMTKHTLYDEKRKEHGLIRRWYKSGAPRSEEQYVHGKKHGLSTQYRDGDDKIVDKSGNYLDGRKHGLWFEAKREQHYWQGRSIDAANFESRRKKYSTGKNAIPAAFNSYKS